MIKTFLITILMTVSYYSQAQELKISNLKTASKTTYEVAYNGFDNDALQYVDRDYLFDRVPETLIGCTLIKVAGNDKMFEEDELCFSFEVNKSVKLHVLYADKYSVNPVWLNSFEKTDQKVYRDDSSEVTQKGIFTVYTKEFPKGKIEVLGCLGKGIKTDAFVKSGGSGYCMYSVLVQEMD